jgi:hypothetical protein
MIRVALFALILALGGGTHYLGSFELLSALTPADVGDAGGHADPNGTDAGGHFDPDGGTTDAGNHWDPFGHADATTDAGGHFDPNGGAADAGGHWDPWG